jgi:hypothetical protein
MPDAWPKASIIMTPGNIGLFGKCPFKKYSSSLIILYFLES